MREQLLMKQIMAVFNVPGTNCRLWRNNVGKYKTPDGGFISYGLSVGSADLIGMAPGGRFLSVEIKTPTGRTRPEQLAWIKTITDLGGIALIIRSVEEAKCALNSFRQNS